MTIFLCRAGQYLFRKYTIHVSKNQNDSKDLNLLWRETLRRMPTFRPAPTSLGLKPPMCDRGWLETKASTSLCLKPPMCDHGWLEIKASTSLGLKPPMCDRGWLEIKASTSLGLKPPMCDRGWLETSFYKPLSQATNVWPWVAWDQLLQAFVSSHQCVTVGGLRPASTSLCLKPPMCDRGWLDTSFYKPWSQATNVWPWVAWDHLLQALISSHQCVTVGGLRPASTSLDLKPPMCDRGWLETSFYKPWSQATNVWPWVAWDQGFYKPWSQATNVWPWVAWDQLLQALVSSHQCVTMGGLRSASTSLGLKPPMCDRGWLEIKASTSLGLKPPMCDRGWLETSFYKPWSQATNVWPWVAWDQLLQALVSSHQCVTMGGLRSRLLQALVSSHQCVTVGGLRPRLLQALVSSHQCVTVGGLRSRLLQALVSSHQCVTVGGLRSASTSLGLKPPMCDRGWLEINASTSLGLKPPMCDRGWLEIIFYKPWSQATNVWPWVAWDQLLQALVSSHQCVTVGGLRPRLLQALVSSHQCVTVGGLRPASTSLGLKPPMCDRGWLETSFYKPWSQATNVWPWVAWDH